MHSLSFFSLLPLCSFIPYYIFWGGEGYAELRYNFGNESMLLEIFLFLIF